MKHPAWICRSSYSFSISVFQASMASWNTECFMLVLKSYNRKKLPRSFIEEVNPAGSIPSLTQDQHTAEAHLAQGATAGLYLTHSFISAGEPPHGPAWTQEHPGTAVTLVSHITPLTYPHQLLHSICFPGNQSCYPTWCQATGIKKRGEVREAMHGVNQGIRNVGTTFLQLCK